MRWFKAVVNEEPVYFYVVTWATARDIARRLWPLEVFEDCWTKMEALDNAPEKGVQAFEWDLELRQPMQAIGYEFDTVAAAKPKVVPRFQPKSKKSTARLVANKRKKIKASRKK